MAMKALIDGECGGANPLMQFTNRLVNDDRNLPSQLNNVRNHIIPVNKPIHSSTAQELADEFLASHQAPYKTAPTTFNMQELLHEIHQPPTQLSHQPPTQLSQHHPLLSTHPPYNQEDFFEEEFQLEKQNLENIDNNSSDWLAEYHQQPIMSQELDEHEIFEEVFKQPLALRHQPAQEHETEDGRLETSLQAHNASLDTREDHEGAQGLAEEWAEEYIEKGEDEIWSNMMQEWSKFSEGWNNESKWSEEFQNFNEVHKEYKFEEDNPLKMDGKEALEEGIRRMNEGDVANAVLFLETAVKQDPTNAMAWYHLGTSQADNEQESLAIAAFNKCIELDPNHLKGMLSLAVEYTNEGMSRKAYEVLLQWFGANHACRGLLEKHPSIDPQHPSDILQLFLDAVDVNNIDPELQTCLGVLFNLAGDYNKAVDCFNTALQICPQDSTLWNKLGATLANGQMSERSIEAYRNALSLRPGYVRTRFNLGVACVNLAAYKESVEHFLSALKLQNESKGPLSPHTTNTSQSDNIWQSLRLSLSLMGRHDLTELCDHHDLSTLLKQFAL